MILGIKPNPVMWMTSNFISLFGEGVWVEDSGSASHFVFGACSQLCPGTRPCSAGGETWFNILQRMSHLLLSHLSGIHFLV